MSPVVGDKGVQSAGDGIRLLFSSRFDSTLVSGPFLFGEGLFISHTGVVRNSEKKKKERDGAYQD
jgi:hypothetical protein